MTFTNNSIASNNGTSTRHNLVPSTDGNFAPRFTGTFTFGQPIVVTNGTFGTTTLQSFNTAATGDQTFNGLISGNGNYKRTASSAGTGGTTVFNAANTFTGGASLNDGTLALVLDS